MMKKLDISWKDLTSTLDDKDRRWLSLIEIELLDDPAYKKTVRTIRSCNSPSQISACVNMITNFIKLRHRSVNYRSTYQKLILMTHLMEKCVEFGMMEGPTTW